MSGISAQDVRVKQAVAILSYWMFHLRQNVYEELRLQADLKKIN